MTRRSRLNSSLFTACCVFALTWSSFAGAEAASPASSEAALNEARLHFSNGVELLQASPPNYQDAYPQFLLAYEKTGQSWKVLGNLGLCALHLERDGEAIDYYRRYLDEGGDEIDPAERKAIEREILLIQGNQAQLKLTASEKNLRITLRREGSTAPTQIYHMTEGGLALGVRAGSYRVTAEGNSKKKSFEFVLEPGQELFQQIEFDAAALPAALSPVPAAPEERSGWTGLQTAGVVTAATGVAAGVAGVVTGLLARQKENDGLDQCRGQICPTSARPTFDEASNLATVSTILFIGGGALAATGITLFLVGGESSSPEEKPVSARSKSSPTVQLTSLPLLGGAALFAEGRF